MTATGTKRPTGANRSRGVTPRPPLRMERVAGLDGLRVLSALGVVVYHVLGAVLGPNPTAGVILPPVALVFFLISGYVIYRPYAAAHIGRGSTPSIGTYYTSRLLRVLPMWWVAIGTYLVVFGTDVLSGPMDWFLTLSLLQVLDADIRYAINGPAWALSTEWLFYLTAPLWGLLTTRIHRSLAPRSRPATFQLATLVPVFGAVVAVPPARPFIAILIGVALAIVDVERARTGKLPSVVVFARTPSVVVTVSAALWAVLAVYPYKEGLSVEWVEGDFRVLLIWTAVATVWFSAVAFGRPEGPVTARLASAPMVWMANLTFGLYLWHELFLRLVLDHLGADVHLLAAMYLVLGPSLLLAAVTFFGVERPMMLFRRRLGRDLAPIPPNPKVPGLASLDRRTRRPVRFAALDGLRVPAAVAVIVFHVVAFHAAGSGDRSDAWVSAVAVAAPVAAAVFLVISAFVQHHRWASAIAAVADGEQVAAAEVDGGALRGVIRRLLRLYPLYWVALLIAWNQGLLDGAESTLEHLGLLLVLPIPDPSVLVDHGLGPLVWVLAAEVVLAVIVPLLGRLGLRAAAGGRRRADALLLGIAAVGVLALVIAGSGAWALIAVPCAVVGIVLADLEARQRFARRRIGWVKAVGGRPGLVTTGAIALIALDLWRFDAQTGSLDAAAIFDGRGASVTATAGLLVFAAVFSPRRASVRQILEARWCSVIAPALYGTHLFTVPVIIAVTLHSTPSPELLGAIVLAAALILGGIGHVAVVAPLTTSGPGRPDGPEPAGEGAGPRADERESDDVPVAGAPPAEEHV